MTGAQSVDLQEGDETSPIEITEADRAALSLRFSREALATNGAALIGSVSLGLFALAEGAAYAFAGLASGGGAIHSSAAITLTVGVTCLFIAYLSAFKVGEYWPFATGKTTPFFCLIDGLTAGPVQYVLENGGITSNLALEEDCMHFASLKAPQRRGRYLYWFRGCNHFVYRVCRDEAEAERLHTEAKRLHATADPNGFDMRAVDGWATATVPAARVHAILSADAKNRGVKAPEVRPVLTTIGLTAGGFATLLVIALAGWYHAQFNSTRAALAVFAVTLAICVIIDLRIHARQLPPWRHVGGLIHGLLRGIDWGKTAARCDGAGLHMQRQYWRATLSWDAIETVDRFDGHMLVTTRDGRKIVTPYLLDAAQHVKSSRLERGLGPWHNPKADPAPQPQKDSLGRWRPILAWVLFFLLALSLFNMVSAAPARAELLRDPAVPSWVDTLDLEPWDQTTDPGVRTPYLLYDRQILLQDGGYREVRRSMVAASDRGFLENAGQISLHVDPSSEMAVLHRLWIHRDGEVIDQTDITFTQLRRERGLAFGYVTGREEHVAHILGLRVGDVVETIWSVDATPSIFSDEFYSAIYPSPPGEGAIGRTRLLVPDDRAIEIRVPDRFAATYSTTQGEDMAEHIWLRTGEAEDTMNGPRPASWDVSNDPVQVSTFTGWSQVVEGLMLAYRARPNLLPPDLQDVVTAIAQETVDPDMRASLALRLVQDRVRYLSVSIGEGGWIPRDPATTWTSGYGDCKDKALLLVSILGKLDIDADVVLVDFSRGRALPRSLPTPYAFDHAIVRIRDAVGDWFVDPTSVLQGGVGRHIRIHDFAFALPLSVGSYGLVPVTEQGLNQPTHEVTQDFTFHDEGEIAAELVVTESFWAEEADARRFSYEGADMATFRDDYEDWYRGRFPGATVTRFEVEDDRDANMIRLVQTYQLPRAEFAEGGLWTDLNHFGYAVAGELRELDEDEVFAGPTDFGDPVHARHRIIMRNLPAPLTAPGHVRFENDVVSFVRSGAWDAETSVWEYAWELRTLRTLLEPGDEVPWREAYAEIDNNDHYRVNLHRRIGEVRVTQPVLAGLALNELFLLALFAPVIGVLWSRARAGQISAIRFQDEKRASVKT
ncbi:DUF3857 domain-containing protein [Rhodophyticola porphyridii]|uniref:DUF3857 domain-containing protein n=1 Tax=Rhodophyticola porphyridii TaxID=1852017 RepID=A0A3L9Y5Q7_9RHOB|nr:DUF3857 domain-containing protein [Rhodophyticola porphyridii]RMA43742.1 DUF3857 domain-containing protein [Rhodophyticola porphyridii]